MKPLLRLVCAFLLLVSLSAEVAARGARSGGSFGGSRSSSSSRSSSFSSGSSSRSSGSSWGGGSSRSSGGSSSSWGSGGSSRFSPNSSGSSTRSAPDSSSSRSGWGTSSSSSTTRSGPSSSATDSALARKVGQGGTTFASRGDAVRDFQQKHAAEYSSRFPTQPSSRPNYIPNSTTVDGRSYPVQYNPGYGGYGYFMGNRWMAYDVMRDALMLNALMGSRNYSYSGGPGYSEDYSPRAAQYRTSSSGSSGGGFLLLIILLVVVVIIWWYRRSQREVKKDPFQAGDAQAATGARGMNPPPVRNLSTSTMDKSQPADWLAVKPNSIVTISDPQGIADSMKRGQGVRGIDYTVSAIVEMKQLDALSTHLLFTLHDEEQKAYLLVKIVDQDIDLGLYIEVESLAPGTRKEIVDRGDLWLFQEPANPQNFQVSDLRFTTSIRQTLPVEGSGEEEVLFGMKGQGELQCDYKEKPSRSGMEDAMATVVEYRTDQPVENPELLILDVGGRRNKNSYIQFFIGCPIKFSEVDVLPA